MNTTTTKNPIVKKAKKILKVTFTELVTVLKETTIINEMAAFASIMQMTEPKTNVKCRDTKEPFFGMIEKLSIVGIILNSKYESGVLNALKKEDKPKEDYKKGRNSMPLIKGDNNNFFGTFNDKAVIEYRPNTNVKVQTQYFLNGKRVEKSSLPNVLPTVRKATNQGTEKEILWRKLYVSNIVEITLNGVTYEVI